MQLERKYVQFNNLVIDNYDMLRSASLSGGFKTGTQEYSYGHGSYAPFKKRQQFSREQSLSMTLHFDARKLVKEDTALYKDFLLHNLTSPGKLWATEGDNLIWANAFVSNFSEAYQMIKGSLSIDVDLVIYEGVWVKADVRKTFLQPYEVCDFSQYFGIRHREKCNECCDDCKTKVNRTCAKCIQECDYLNKEHSLCNTKIDFSNCDTYIIHHNCTAGRRIWSEEELWGHKICKKHADQYNIYGNFYSHTVLDSDRVTVRLLGQFKDPIITINGISLQIKGEYKGLITVTEDWSVLYLPEGECADEVEVDVGKVIVNNAIGFLVYYGKNTVHVDGVECCGFSCIFIKEEELTI